MWEIIQLRLMAARHCLLPVPHSLFLFYLFIFPSFHLLENLERRPGVKPRFQGTIRVNELQIRTRSPTAKIRVGTHGTEIVLVNHSIKFSYYDILVWHECLVETLPLRPLAHTAGECVIWFCEGREEKPEYECTSIRCQRLDDRQTIAKKENDSCGYHNSSHKESISIELSIQLQEEQEFHLSTNKPGDLSNLECRGRTQVSDFCYIERGSNSEINIR